jgi:Zn-dependent protease/predicted transcriptional regulator
MSASLRVGRVAGIDLHLHWTFGALLLGAFAYYLLGGQPVGTALAGVLLIVAVFACVVLHEFGHALAAARYGIATRDITLYPIGGVARLERIPEKPGQELVVALAGPVVNVALAGAAWAVLAALGRPLGPPTGLGDPAAGFGANVFWANVVLAAFNLLPAFPMDGGRVLRALLAMKLDYGRATRIAARVGQAMAIVFGFVAVTNGFDPFLLFVALFVYLGAEQEANSTLLRSAARGLTARDAMLTEFTALGPGSTLGEAVDHLLAGAEKEFPVLGVNGHLAGVLTSTRLVKSLTLADRDTRVFEVMELPGPPVEAGAPLDAALDRLRESAAAMLPVVHGGRLVGVLTLENVGELMMLAAAVGRRTGAGRQAVISDLVGPRRRTVAPHEG